MRVLGLLTVLLVLSIALADTTVSTPAMPTDYSGSGSSDSKIGVTSVGRESESCNSSPFFIDAVKASMVSEYSLADYTFSNLTSEYCYTYGGYKSINLNFIFKTSESDYKSKTVSASFYISDSIDYSVLFNERENNVIDYTLKNKYLDFYVNGTDEEYFVSLAPVYSESSNGCDALRSYYESLPGEKYFNDENSYCSVILKTKTSLVKSLVNDAVSYVSYFGAKVNFYFSGSSTGSYDLSALSKSINCSLSNADYYYPEEFDCYGIYKDKTRVYFGASKNLGTETDYKSVSVSVYGYLNGKAKITVSAYGENVNVDEVNSFASETLSKFFDGAYAVSVKSTGYGYEGSLIIDSLVLKADALNGLNVSTSMMDYYYSDNVYFTISEPYIQVFIPETPSQSQAELIRPIHWGRNLVITESNVYSSVTLDVNDKELAVVNIKESTSPYVATNDWLLNMSVTGNYYYPLMYEKSSVNGVSVGIASNDAAASMEGGASIQSSTGVRDAFTTANSDADFASLDAPAPSIFGMIVAWFNGLFGLA